MKKRILFFCTLLFFCAAIARAGNYGYWMMADSMHYPKGGTSTLLHSGKVLVAGHKYVCELYDYTVDEWTVADSLSTERKGHELVTLLDGRALVAGDENININEIFDETTGLWKLCDSFRLGPRYGGTLTVLTNGKVLYAGGNVSGRISSSCELYDPKTDTWTIVDSMTTSRLGHASVLLSGGRVLVTGGGNFVTGRLSSCEVYDPVKNLWLEFPSMNTNHGEHKTMLLDDYRIVVLGGSSGPDGRSCEYYDWETDKWIMTDGTRLRFGKNNAVNLGNGYILVASGDQFELVSVDLLYSEHIIFYKNTYSGGIGMELLPDGSVLSIGDHAHSGGVIKTTSACERYFPATTKVEMQDNKSIKSFELHQNYPNPFNPQTIISYDLAKPYLVKIEIFNVTGQHIQTLINKNQPAGWHHVQFDASTLTSGIYYYRLSTPDFVETRKMVKIE